MSNFHFIKITEENMLEHKDVICYINQKHPTYHLKIEWLNQRFKEGYTIKLAYQDGVKKAAGFIEYVPGKYNWRAVEADDYMFIHCIFIGAKKNQGVGLGKMLIEECEKDTKELGLKGIAVLTSDDTFMAKKDLFLKNGYEVIETAKPKYTLLAKKFTEAEAPKILDNSACLKDYKGLHLFYSKQCPWVARMVDELRDEIKAWNIDIEVHELTTPEEARKAPSPYGTFTLTYNEKVLSQHYISFRRLHNILKKEKLI